MKRAIALLVALIIWAPTLVHGAWTPNGVNLSNAPFEGAGISFPQVVGDGAGGAVVAWQHRTDLLDSTNVRVCRVDATGTLMWTADACALPDDQDRPALVADGFGGYIVAWRDMRSTSPGSGIYAQRLDADGNASWTPDGVRISDVLPWDDSIRIASDDSMGAYIAWRDERAGNFMFDVYVQRVRPDGSTWADPGGYNVSVPTNVQYFNEIVEDGAGGLVVVWLENGIGIVRAQRIDRSANLMWGASGSQVLPINGWLPSVTMSGVGNYIVIWRDSREGYFAIFAQKLNASGVAQWTPNGINLTGGTVSNAVEASVVGDDAGGAFLVWSEQQTLPSEIGVWARHIDGVGSTSPVTSISAPGAHDNEPSLSKDGAGGAFIAWRWDAVGADNIYGQWLDPDGNIRFAPGGIVLCDAGGLQSSADVTRSGVGRAVAIWMDERDSPVIDVFAQIMEGNTPAGPNVVVTPQDVTTGTSPVTLTFDNVTSPGVTSLTSSSSGPPLPSWFTSTGAYYNITTNATFTGPIEVCIEYDPSALPGAEIGAQLLHYDGSMWTDITTSVDTLANVVCGTTTTLSPFAVGVSTVTGIDGKVTPHEFALHANVPNPFNPVTTIAYDIPTAGADVNIAIYDAAGRLVRELVDEHRAAGRWSMQWNGEDARGQRVASGVYFYRMRAGSFVDTKKMVLLK